VAGNGHGSNVSCSACGEGLVCPFAATLEGLKTGTVTESALACGVVEIALGETPNGWVFQNAFSKEKTTSNQKTCLDL